MWINPKTNWKATDYLNYADLNRIEKNTEFVAEYLVNISYIVPIGTVVSNRTMQSIDFISSINRLEENIDIIKNSFLTPPGWQDKKVWSLGKGFSYDDANRLENNLKILKEWAEIAKDNLVYCGTFNCGTDWKGGLY